MATKPKGARQGAAHQALVTQLQTILPVMEAPFAASIDTMAGLCNQLAVSNGFWESDNTAEKIALMHSELSEALEADRKGLEAEHIEGFDGIEEELADCVIRIFDFAAQKQLRLGEAIIAKSLFNTERPYKHGKAY